MTDFRLVALDVDGTILTPAGEMTPRFRAAAREARARGVTLALATARRWVGASPIARELEAASELILYDGAIRRAFPSGAVEVIEPLARDVALEAARRIVAGGLRAVAQYSPLAGERMVSSAEPPVGGWMESYLDRFAHQVRYERVTQLVRGRATPLRLVSFGPLARLAPLSESLADLDAGRQILPLGSYGQAELTVFAPAVSKGSALVRLAGDMGISRAETLAIGDGVNDISMLRAAGLGVAMGHAAPGVRAAAGAVTGTNAEDGAALAIERYVLGMRMEEPA